MPTSSKIIIFTGPSLSAQEASQILDADYRGPVQRDDILKALHESPDIIGIIDGVFHQQPAVSHREIMEALKKGVIVVGGSSMGALRASELDDLGMVGVGYVYNQYKSGAIESDDDVAVVFTPDTFEQLSDALVSVHYNLQKAHEKGLINAAQLELLVNTAKKIFYPKRTYKKIFNDSNLDLKIIERLDEFITNENCDIKREDALKVLNYIKNLQY